MRLNWVPTSTPWNSMAASLSGLLPLLDLLDGDRRGAPDLVGVLPDRPVAGEFAHVGHVQDRLPRPRRLIAIGLPDALLAGDVGRVVREQEEVVPAQERVHQGPEEARLPQAESSARTHVPPAG